MAKRIKAKRRGSKRRTTQTRDDPFDEDGTDEGGTDGEGTDEDEGSIAGDGEDDEREVAAARPEKSPPKARSQEVPRASGPNAADPDAPTSKSGGLIVMGVVFALMVLAMAVQHFIE